MKHLLFLALIAATLFTSCSSTKLGKQVTAQINLTLPKDSAGHPITLSKSNVREIWPQIKPFYVSKVQALVLLLPDLPERIVMNMNTLTAAIDAAVLQIVPGAAYAGIKDGAVKAIYLQVDKHLALVEEVFAIYFSSDVSWLIHRIRAVLNYVVYGDGMASPLYGIPALR